jgi:hypothetical protein
MLLQYNFLNLLCLLCLLSNDGFLGRLWSSLSLLSLAKPMLGIEGYLQGIISDHETQQ